nr:MAG: 6-carboxytetrahydropterin synthase [Hyphomicrobiales bacterium]
MYAVTVRDHFMIAHSFRGETFGPAQGLHGATYVVDVEFRRSALDADNIVVDIGKASEIVKDVLNGWNFNNLDTVEEFSGANTTTEFMAHAVFEKIRARIAAGDFGPHARGLAALKVTLHESHIAWASYEGAL